MTETWPNRLMLTLQWGVAGLSYGMVNYRHPLREEALKEAKYARSVAEVASTPLECAEIYNAVKATEKIAGDMAEAGVYRGGTAAVMLAASLQKRLHLFDTFKGLPHGEGEFASGEWKGSVAEVRANLSRWPGRIECHEGLFPESATGMESMRFSFVHLDLDLYDSTLAALNWFWPRLAEGGVLMSHDYPLVDGVVKAFTEFFSQVNEPFIPLSGNQCLAVKGRT